MDRGSCAGGGPGDWLDVEFSGSGGGDLGGRGAGEGEAGEGAGAEQTGWGGRFHRETGSRKRGRGKGGFMSSGFRVQG